MSKTLVHIVTVKDIIVVNINFISKNKVNHLEVRLDFVILTDRKVVEHNSLEWYNTLHYIKCLCENFVSR